MTTITRLRTEINADLPVLTQARGIVEHCELGLYLNRCADEGWNPTDAEFDALTAFFNEGRRYGWLAKLLYVLPFAGAADTPKAAAVPLIDRFHGHAPLRVAASTYGLDFNDNYAPYFKTDSGRVTGSVPYRTDMCLVTPLSALDMFLKYDGCSNVRNGNYGISWYGTLGVVESDSVARICGAGKEGSNLENYAGIGGSRYMQRVFGRACETENVGQNLHSGKFFHLGQFVTEDGKNIIKYRLHDSGLSGLVYGDETATRDNVTTINEEFFAEVFFGVNATWTNSTKKVSFSNLDTGVESRWLAFHDGTLDERDMVSYLPALKALLSAFGKIG